MTQIFDLDGQATSPLLPEALAAMLPWLENQHWNPHSAHRGGRMAKAAVEAGRIQIAARMGVQAEGLLFTSGATEANNLAIKGFSENAPSARILTFATEHSCVLQTVQHLERLGVPVQILPVLPDGMPDLGAYQQALSAGAGLVSAMWVNNEIGTIWPIQHMAKMAHEHGALFHTDCAQALGKLDISNSGADLISVSAHKIGGPKGIGALWVREGIKLAPQLDGGGQEGGVRSGTLAPALIAGFAAAARLSDPIKRQAHAADLMTVALEILAQVPHHIHGADPQGGARWAGNLSVQFLGVDGSRLMSALPNIALSSGSACSSGTGKLSHVLAAIGVSVPDARQTLRIGWNHAMSAEMLTEALNQLVSGVRKLGARA